MNIQMQMAGFGVLIFLLCFYLRRKSVGLYTEVFFKWTMIVTLANVTMDVLSIVAITNRDLFPGWLCFAICKSYLILLIWTGCCGLLYICQDIYSGLKRIQFLIGFSAGAVIENMIVLFLPIFYHQSGREIYTYGPSVIATYIFCVIFVIMTLVMALIHRKHMIQARVEAVVMWILVWMIAAFIQFFFNQLLLVGYASCLGMMILFFKLENPEASIDRETGAFNSHILLKYMQQLFERGDYFALLLVGLEQYQGIAEGYEKAELRKIFKFLRAQGNAKVFKSVEQEFVLLFEDRKQYEQSLPKIRERFAGEWDGRYYEPVYVAVPDSCVAGSALEIYQLLRYYKQNVEYLDQHSMVKIDERLVEERRQYRKMEETICEALAEDRVEIFLQPIYSVSRERYMAAEALARIRRADGTIVPPGQFIAVAEETGLISSLGERVFEKTCQFIKREKIWEWGLDYIEVNLSVRQCESRELADRYIAIMKQYDVQPSMVNLEVTESVSIRMRNILLKNMEQLIEFGVSFSLDDFGNGESNLNYIVDMPVQIVKFDRDMTRAYFEKDKGRFVMEAATRMILDMGLKIVSEGVETSAQLEGMRQLGVHYIQGYYFSKPLPEIEFVNFVKESRKVVK